MPGTVIRLISRKEYDFSNVPANKDASVILALRIPVETWKYATLLIRLHEGDIAQTNGVLRIMAFADGFTQEDPTIRFWDFLLQEDISKTDVDTDAPLIRTVGLSRARIGAMIAVTLQGDQDPANSGTLKGTFSIDLALKN